MSAARFVLAAGGHVVHKPDSVCDQCPSSAGLSNDTTSPFPVLSRRMLMQHSFDLEPNTPAWIIRVFDLKIIHHFQNALSSKQARRTPPVV